MLITELDIGLKSMGEKNFVNSFYEPYTGYLDELFPSGEDENINFILSKVQYLWRKKISTPIKSEYNVSNKYCEKICTKIWVSYLLRS